MHVCVFVFTFMYVSTNTYASPCLHAYVHRLTLQQRQRDRERERERPQLCLPVQQLRYVGKYIFFKHLQIPTERVRQVIDMVKDEPQSRKDLPDLLLNPTYIL